MRELFAEAKKVKPAIIFIDEIDTVGGKRNDFDHPKARMSLNQLLTELDGFSENSGVIVIAATNYAETLDPALLRPGRFDRHVSVPVPDIKGRREVRTRNANTQREERCDAGAAAQCIEAVGEMEAGRLRSHGLLSQLRAHPLSSARSSAHLHPH